MIDYTQVVLCSNITRVQSQGPLKVVDSLTMLPQLFIDQTQVVVALRV